MVTVMYEKLRDWYENYALKFMNESRALSDATRLKREHTLRVVDDIELIGSREGLSGADIDIARVIALLHDVGRFQQYRDFGTFMDRDSINHAKLSAKVAFDNGLLADKPDAELILNAIKFHNAFQIPTGLDDRTHMFLKLIRDADKLDIYAVTRKYYEAAPDERVEAVGLGLPDCDQINPDVLRHIAQGQIVPLKLVRCLDEYKLLTLSWVYDLNFKATHELFAKRDVASRIFSTMSKRIQAKSGVREATQVVMDFSGSKIR